MALTSQITTSLLQVNGRMTEGGVIEIVPGARLLLDVGVEDIEPGALLDEIATAVAEAQAARDQAVDISGISTSDGVMAAVAADPESEFAQVQSATYATAHVLTGSGIDATGTGDTTTALQARLSAAPNDSAVYLPPGIYRLTTTLTVDKRVRVFGPGVLRWTAGISNVAALKVTAAGATLDGLHLENPNLIGANTGSSSTGISINADDVTVTGCTVDSFVTGVTVHQSGEFQGFRIIGNRIKDVLGAGDGPANTTSAFGEDRGDGVFVSGAVGVVADNVINAKAGRDARIGIHHESLTDQQTTHPTTEDSLVTITGNVVTGPFRRSIATENTSYTTISGNTCEGATWWAISVSGTCTAVTVTGNTIKWTRTSADQTGQAWGPIKTCIQVLNAVRSCTISGNVAVVVNGAQADNFLAIAGSGGLGFPGVVTATENILITEGTGTVAVGITANGASCEELRLSGNTVKGSTVAAVNVGDSDRFDVVGNKLWGVAGSTSWGVLAGGATSGGSISDNTIKDCATAIERTNSLGGDLLCRNRVVDCATGVNTYSSDRALIAHNIWDGVTTATANVGANSVTSSNVTVP